MNALPFDSGGQCNIPIQTQKPSTTLSAIGIGYGVINTAVGVPLIPSTAIPMGGSTQVLWGFPGNGSSRSGYSNDPC